MQTISSFKKRTILASATATLLALLLTPSNEPLYNMIMFPFPDPRTPDVSADMKQLNDLNIKSREVQFKTSNGNKLHAIFLELPGTRRVILLSHGKGNNIYCQFPKARLLLSCGASVFMYDYQGFGKSQGRPSIEGACNDAVAAYDYLIQKENRKPEDIIAFGQSFGSGVVGQLSLRRKLAGIVIHSGFGSLTTAARDTLFWLKMYPDWTFPRQMMDNIAVFTKAHPPVLIVHGTTDTVLGFNRAVELYNSASEPKQFLKLETGHSGFGKTNLFAITMREFIAKHGL